MIFKKEPDFQALFAYPIESPWRHKVVGLEDLSNEQRLTRLLQLNQNPRPVSDPDAFSWISPAHLAQGGIHRREVCVKLPATPYVLPDDLSHFAPMLADMITCYATSAPFGQPSSHTTCWLYLSYGTLSKGDVSRDIAGLFHTDLQLTRLRDRIRNTTNVLASDVPEMMTRLYFKPLELEGEEFGSIQSGTADEATAAFHGMCRQQFSLRDAFTASPLTYSVYDGLLPHHGVPAGTDGLRRSMHLAIFSTDGNPLCQWALNSNPALAAYVARTQSPALPS